MKNGIQTILYFSRSKYKVAVFIRLLDLLCGLCIKHSSLMCDSCFAICNRFGECNDCNLSSMIAIWVFELV